MAEFTELVAAAIANAESRADLAASRGRIVATADETRRRIERDPHDGVQQRLVSLALELRGAQAAVPPQLGELDGELSRVVEGLSGVQDELREIARGVHPARRLGDAHQTTGPCTSPSATTASAAPIRRADPGSSGWVTVWRLWAARSRSKALAAAGPRSRRSFRLTNLVPTSAEESRGRTN